MSLLRVNENQIRSVREEYDLNEEKMREGVQILREWLNKQPHLPHDCDDRRLERFLVRCRNSIEMTKNTIDMYYTLKNALPELLCGRDPANPWFKNINDSMTVVPMPTLTKDHNRILIMGCKDPDVTKFNCADLLKNYTLYQDIRLNEDYSIGDIIIVDMTNGTLGHMSKVSLPLLKRTEVCHSKAFQLRIKAIHILNAPTFIDILMTIAKSVLKPRVASRIRTHANLESLYEYVPKQLLPLEYGGEAGLLSDIETSWLNHVESCRDWILDQEDKKTDESKRPGKPVSDGDLFGFMGSFRQLSVD